MTSFAFIFGLLPLLFSAGAGALARHSLGTAVIGGMLVSTALNLFIIPVFYVLFVRDRNRRDDEPVSSPPSFEEGNYSVTDVFDEESPGGEENGKKAGLINYINDEDKEGAPSQPKGPSDPAKDDAPKDKGETPSDGDEKE